MTTPQANPSSTTPMPVANAPGLGVGIPQQIGAQQIQPGMQVVQQPGPGGVVVQQRMPTHVVQPATGVANVANPNAAKQSLTQQQLQQLQMQGQLHHMPQHPMGMMPDDNEIISKRKLHELVAQLSPNEKLDTEVEEVLIEFIEDFIEQVTSSACNLAKHRNSNVLEVKDLVCLLERNWNIKIPGYGSATTDTVKSYKRPFTSQAHQTRLSLVRKSLASKKPKIG